MAYQTYESSELVAHAVLAKTEVLFLEQCGLLIGISTLLFFFVLQLACCCGSAACSLCCAACPSTRSSLTTRVMYAGMLVVGTFVSCLMLAPGIQAKLADVRFSRFYVVIFFGFTPVFEDMRVLMLFLHYGESAAEEGLKNVSSGKQIGKVSKDNSRCT